MTNRSEDEAVGIMKPAANGAAFMSGCSGVSDREFFLSNLQEL